MVPFRLISCHPESCSEAAYRCDPGTAAWAAESGGCEPQAHHRLCLPLPKPAQGPACPPPSPGFPSPLLWCGLERKLSALQGSAARIREEVGRGQGFPSNLWQAWLRESFSKFPAAPAQVASAGRGDGGKSASLATAPTSAAAAANSAFWAASSLAGSGPGSPRAGPPGAKAAADAGGSEGGSCPAPTAQAASRRLYLGPRRAGRNAEA